MPIDMNALHLPDDAFWGEGNRAFDPVVRQHGTSHFGVVVDAPRRVDLAARKTLPVFLYYMGEFRELVTRDLQKQGLVTVMDVERNALWITPTRVQDAGEEPDPEEVAPPEEPVPDGYAAEIQTLELRERLSLAWKPARLILQAILLDLQSPRVETELAAGSSQFQDPEVEKFLAEERAARNPPPLFPAPAPEDRYPSYARTAASPEMPEGNGVALQVDRVVTVDSAKPVLLHGAWRLPVRPEDLVKPANAEYNRANGLLQPGGEPYAAVVRIHVLAVGVADDTPKIYSLAVPVAGVVDSQASGYFSVDLRKLPDFPIADQTVFFYAFSREYASAPAVMGMLDRRPEE
jgi:hypothetical protein